MKAKVTLSYNGAYFNGSQSQNDGTPTVLGMLYKALKELKIDSKINASGRTDAYVHALGQVIDFSLPYHWQDSAKLKTVLNHHLPSSIRIKKVELVDDNFHSRYSAKRRVYRYILSMKEPNPFEADFVTFVKNIDIDLLKRAIKEFEGVHNFEYFKKSGAVSTNYVREIFKTSLYVHNDYVVLYFEASGFLRSQIRMMVSFLLEISNKRFSIENLKEQLECKKIYSTHLTHPNGLYLAKIKY